MTASLNKIQLIGYLGTEPKSISTQSCQSNLREMLQEESKI